MKRHGACDTITYTSWQGMISRCYCQSNDRYKWYGGRGIKVCERWLGEYGFKNFVADMGERPSKKHSIDRINGNFGYIPTNCRWVTHREQCRNKLNTLFVLVGDRRVDLKSECERLGLSYHTVWQRINRLGWSLEKALGV